MRKGLLSYLLLSTVLITVAKSDFQVNTRTPSNQQKASVAMDDNGNFTVVWNSYDQDGDSGGIFGQRFDQDCEPIGREFPINTTTEGNQTEPAIAVDSSGNFVVVWHGPEMVGEEDEDIFSQRFDPNGLHIGGEFHVNTKMVGKQQNPSVAMNNEGRFVVAWETSATSGDRRSIKARVYDQTGAPIDFELKISDSSSNCYDPDVAIDDSGGFVVVWRQGEYKQYSILAMLYDPEGVPRTSIIRVNTTDVRTVTKPSVAMTPGGLFIITWDNHPDGANLDDILIRLYESDGTPIGEQFVVNTTLSGSQQWPQVAMNNQREFVIVWDSKIDPNVNERDIFGQRYSSSGEPIGDEFQVNTYTEDDQKYPAVALREDGVFVTVWQSDEQDGSDYDIFGRMLSWISSADFNNDGIVDFEDFCVLAQQWQQTGDTLSADLDGDETVDRRDLTAFCQQWLTP